MPYESLGTLEVNENWRTYATPLDSQQIRLIFSAAYDVPAYTSAFFRTKVGDDGFSGEWKRIFYSNEPAIFKIDLFPGPPNELQIKLADNNRSREEIFTVRAEQFTNNATGVAFTVNGSVFNINGEEFLI